MADFYGVDKRLVAEIDYLTKIGGSSLTDQDIPVSAADLSANDIPTSYVPFRNTHLIAIAVSWAEVIGATKVFMEPSAKTVLVTLIAGLNIMKRITD